jgi:hypothetical protein
MSIPTNQNSIPNLLGSPVAGIGDFWVGAACPGRPGR